MFAARTHPALTCQAFEGRFRIPMAFAVRTPLVSTVAWSRWTALMYCGWWLPGTPAIPARGILVQVMEYFHPVFFSKTVMFFLCRRDSFTRRAMNRSPSARSAPCSSGE